MADLKFFYTFVCVNYTSDKMNTNNNYCLILAGGRGLRLWPYSRMSFPKQFVDFFGVGRSQLQQTFDRFAQLIDTSHIFVSTNESYADIVRNQLPELPSENILVEPIYRSTAPSVAWASHRILRLCADANIVVTPSDQAIQKEDAFQRDIIRGLEFVSRTDGMLTLGVKPTRPEPGYGYIQMGKEVENDVFAVQSFTEKPDREFAQMFMKSGNFTGTRACFSLTHGSPSNVSANFCPQFLDNTTPKIRNSTYTKKQLSSAKTSHSTPTCLSNTAYWSRPTMCM